MDTTLQIAWDEQVELCRKGNTQAYHKVYLRYAKPMLNSSMRILNNLADAEDMVQEAFIDAFSNLDRFTYKSSFEAWLRRIVINKSISLLRKKKIQWVHTEIANIATDEDEADEESFQYDIQRIQRIIAGLPENYRIIFSLFAIDGLPQKEIAKLLNIGHSNVRIIYHRARKKIQEGLQHEYRKEQA